MNRDNSLIDWDSFNLNEGNAFTDYWNFEKTYPENFLSFLNRGIALEHEPIISRVLASYTVANSKLSKVIPILFLYGSSGSGKSLLSFFIASFRGEGHNMVGSSTTFAALRNHIQQQRWYMVDRDLNTSLSNEKPYIVVWSDIKETSLIGQDDKMYSLFRNGCYRKEEKIFISSGDGSNIPFYVFGQKVISTIENFADKPRWSELYRRCFFVYTKKFSDLDPVYLSEFKSRDLIDYESIDFKGVEKFYEAHWNIDRIRAVQSGIKSKQRTKKKYAENFGLSDNEFEISFDVIVQAVASHIFPSLESAYQCFGAYFALCRKSQKTSDKPLLCQILEGFIGTKEQDHASLCEKFKANGMKHLVKPFTLNPRDVKAVIDEAKKDGVIQAVSTNDLIEAMGQLGFVVAKADKGFMWAKVI